METITRCMDGKINIVIKKSVWDKAQELFNAGNRTLYYARVVTEALIAHGVDIAHAREVAVLARAEM